MSSNCFVTQNCHDSSTKQKEMLLKLPPITKSAIIWNNIGFFKQTSHETDINEAEIHPGEPPSDPPVNFSLLRETEQQVPLWVPLYVLLWVPVGSSVCFTWSFRCWGSPWSSTVLRTDRPRTRGRPCAGPAALGGWQTGPETQNVCMRQTKCTHQPLWTSPGLFSFILNPSIVVINQRHKLKFWVVASKRTFTISHRGFSDSSLMRLIKLLLAKWYLDNISRSFMQV